MTPGPKIIFVKWYDAVLNQWKWECPACCVEHGTTLSGLDNDGGANTVILGHLDRAHPRRTYDIETR
jgi:hypothetical protein